MILASSAKSLLSCEETEKAKRERETEGESEKSTDGVL